MPFTYDARTGRYFYPNGEPVPVSLLRGVLEDVIGDSHARLRVLSERWAAGALDTLGWREAARAELKVGHSLAAQLAYGGREGMDARARGWLGSQLREQFQFLDRLTLQAATGDLEKAGAQMQNRLGQYAQGIWSTFQEGRGRVAADQGLDEERNVLDAGADHCDGCLAASDQDWQPIGSLDPPGSRDCLSRCRCELEFRTSAEAAVGAEVSP